MIYIYNIYKAMIILFLAITLTVPIMAWAQAGETPFGAQIITTTLPPIICTGTGVVTQRNVGKNSGGGRYVVPVSARSWVGTVSPIAWVLGFLGASNSDSSSCYIQAGPYRIQQTVTPYSRYGTSSGSFGGFGF
ncbi:MAG: hypothetical protein OEX08_00360 [Candidatus Nomurabacteria bacterium]|nr:hypothetical protein [Candidatus Nomurabacteria bacterium]